MCKFPGTLSKKVFSLLVLVSFLSQNCLFPLPVSAISGDKLSAQSFFQTEQVKNIISRIKEQGLDKELKSVLTILTPRLTKALELYLKTIILRRKRQQELLLERELLHEMEILGQLDELRKQGILVKHIAQMDNVELRALIKQLPDGKWFRQELERRHNGIDAAYFSENAEDSYALLQELADDGFIAADSPFRQAAAVIAYAKTAGKYVNSLTGVDFTLGQLDEVSGNQAEANYLRKIFNFYTQEIKKEHKKDLYFKRGAVPCMLYELGITAFPRMSSWRMHVPGDPQKGLDPAEQKRAEECILRLIDFLSDHEITKEGKVINRICKKSYAETANALVYNDYTKGSVSAALEQRLGFKAGGIVNPFDPAPGDAFNFNALVINACKRRMQAGDARFAGVSEEAMFRSYVGKVTLPRIRAMCMFGWSIFGYNLLRTRNLLQLKDIIDRYFNYVGGNELMLTKDECDLVDELYQKLNEKLLAQFELGEGEALGEDLPQALIDLLIVLSNLPYNRNEQGSYAAEKYPDRYPQELREEMQLLRSLAAKFVPRQAKIGNLAYRQYKALPDSFKQGAVRIITSQDLDSAETKAQMQRLAVIYNELIVSSKQLLAAMVYRYNSRRPLWGPLRDSLVQTPAWASGIWAKWLCHP